MKLKCNDCDTIYHVSEAKIRGRRLSVRCRSCSGLMTVNGSASTGDAPTSDTEKSTNPSALFNLNELLSASPAFAGASDGPLFDDDWEVKPATENDQGLEVSGLINLQSLIAAQESTEPERFVVSPIGSGAVRISRQRRKGSLYAVLGAVAAIVMGLLAAMTVVLMQSPAEAIPGPDERYSALSLDEDGSVRPIQRDLDFGDEKVAMVAGASRDGALSALSIQTMAQSVVATLGGLEAPEPESRPNETATSTPSIPSAPERDATPTEDNTNVQNQVAERDGRQALAERTDRVETHDSTGPVESTQNVLARETDEQTDGRVGELLASLNNDTTPEVVTEVDEELASLSTADISRTIRRQRRNLAACRADAGLARDVVLEIDVAMSIAVSGRVVSAATDSDSRAANCVVDVLRDIDFPVFGGSSINFTYPVRIR